MEEKKLTWRGFEYRPETGEFYRGGKLVTSKTGGGYRRLSYGKYGKYAQAHRIAYQLMVKRVPKDKEIDHINGNILDNRIENLRIVTIRENQQNKKIHRETSRLVGAYLDNNKWRAQVFYKRKKRYIGLFESELEAHSAYMNFLDDHKLPYLEEMDKRGQL